MSGIGICKGTLVTGKHGFKVVEDVIVGDNIKTMDGTYVPVSDIQHFADVPIITVSVCGSEDLKVTPDVIFYARKQVWDSKQEFSKTGLEWINAKNLSNKYMVAYCNDIIPSQQIETSFQQAKDYAKHAKEHGFFTKGVFELPIIVQRWILYEYFMSNTAVRGHDRGTIIEIGTENQNMAYSIARLIRNCSRSAVNIKEDSSDSILPYKIDILLNTPNSMSWYEDGIVWQPVEGVVNNNEISDVYWLTINSENNNFLANDIIIGG